jgi:hypothetical protein
MDIPTWLYEGMGGAGAFYDAGFPHSAGFAPDYENHFFIERHDMLVKAVAERYDSSPDIAFVQLGSLGHWGEWHNVNVPGEYFPSEYYTNMYVRQYTTAFKQTILQMRRPFTIMNESRIGFFNDMIGHEDQTSWLRNEMRRFGMLDSYLRVPMGGEFASTYTIYDYFGDMYGEVKKMITDTHVTYAGCLPPSGDEYRANRLDLLKTMGYRFYISSSKNTIRVQPGESAEFSITVQNLGVAPFYYDWPFYLLVYDDDGNLVEEHRFKDKVRNIVPGKDYILEAELPSIDIEGKYLVKLGMFDPLNTERKKADIRLVNEKADADNLLVVGLFFVDTTQNETQ